MIDNEQVKIGQTIWFESRGKIESGPVYGACGVNMWHIKIDGALIPFSIWGLYPTKSACVRAKLERADAELNSLNERCVELERLCGDLAAQIKEEEKERAANAVGKAHPVRWVNSRFGELVLVQLPRCIEAGVKDRKEESPVVVRTDHVLLQYEYGCTPNSDGSLTHNGLVIIYPADKLGRIVSVKDMPWKSIHVDRHPRNYGVTVDDTRAAVKSLGFELED